MKTILIASFSILLLSCYSQDSKISQLNERITFLEQRMDLLINNGRYCSTSNHGSTASDNFVWVRNQCKAITKRGKACKRKGKYNGYCWQHRN